MGLIATDPALEPKHKDLERKGINNLMLDQDHQYWLDGSKIDGLTSSMWEGGLIRNSDQKYMDRGTAIHLATEYFDKGLESESVSDDLRGYVESWKRFRADQDYQPVEIEYPIYHPELRVGTTIDRLPGPVDLKSGSPEKWHILQIALQWSALIAHGMHDLARMPMDVYLSADGGPPKVRAYKISEVKEAFKAYSSMLYFLRWRRG